MIDHYGYGMPFLACLEKIMMLVCLKNPHLWITCFMENPMTSNSKWMAKSTKDIISLHMVFIHLQVV